VRLESNVESVLGEWVVPRARIAGVRVIALFGQVVGLGFGFTGTGTPEPTHYSSQSTAKKKNPQQLVVRDGDQNAFGRVRNGVVLDSRRGRGGCGLDLECVRDSIGGLVFLDSLEYGHFLQRGVGRGQRFVKLG